MQSALRSAARRAAGAAGRRGVATTAGGEREWLASRVQLEVRAQMLAVEEKAALQRATEAECSARRRATKLELDGFWKARRSWWDGYWKGYLGGCTVGAVVGILAFKK